MDDWLSPWRDVLVGIVGVIQGGLQSSVTGAIARDGVFERRDSLSAAFYAVSIVHALGRGALLVYPFITRSRAWDGWYLVVLAATLVLSCGENLFSWLEKRLYYTAYAMGAAPSHRWWMDAVPSLRLTRWLPLLVAVNIVGLALVLLRSVELSKWRVDGSLLFRLPRGRMWEAHAAMALRQTLPDT